MVFALGGVVLFFCVFRYTGTRGSPAMTAGAKKDRKVFIDAITAERTEISKERTARKKLRKELCKEVRIKVRALKKS